MRGNHFKKYVFFALMLAAALLCAAALAEGVSTKEELYEAVKAAKGGEVIALSADITLDSEYALVNSKGKEIMIDLGGHTLKSAYFEQGTYSVRNGTVIGAYLLGEGKAIAVHLAEDVRCKGTTITAVLIDDRNGGKIAFSNAGSIDGPYGIQINQYRKSTIQIINTGTITADAYAIYSLSEADGAVKIVNDGLLESRCCAAVRIQPTTDKHKATLSIEGAGALTGACGVHSTGNTTLTIDQRITAVYTSEKNQAVLAQEEDRKRIYQVQFITIMGKMTDENNESMLKFASLRDEATNGVAVAIQNENGDANKLTLSGTLSATNRLLLLPGALPFGSKMSVAVHSSLAPDSKADSFDVWLPLEKRPAEFNEAGAEKQLKAAMKRLDVEGFLAGGGRLRVCVSAPVLNQEGKMLISVTRSALVQELMGGYLTAEGMEWDTGVAEEIYNQKSTVLTDGEELIDAFEDAMAARDQYAIDLDCDVIVENSDTGTQSRFHAFRPKKGGMLYVEGNGHILQNGILSLGSPATLRNLTFNGLRCYNGKVTIENSRFTSLDFSQANANLIGVTATSEDARLELWDTDAQIDAGCTAAFLSATLDDKGTMTILNNGNVSQELALSVRGGTIKLSGEGQARSIELYDESEYWNKKAVFKVEHDADELEINAGPGTTVAYKGNVEGNVEIERLEKGASITLSGTVGGEVVVAINPKKIGLEADGKTVEKYVQACLKGLKLSNCKTAENEAVTVRLRDYDAMYLRTSEMSEDELTLTANIVKYDVSYDGAQVICTGRTNTTQEWKWQKNGSGWGDPVFETVVRYDAEGNVID